MGVTYDMTKYSTITEYKGKGRCVTVHEKTGKTFATDLHKEMGGLEENPSPSEMLAATLASCMMSMVTHIAGRKNIDLTGMKMEASPVFNGAGKIEKMALRVTMPLPGNHPMRNALELSAQTCPVHNTMKNNVEMLIEWIWQ